MRDSKGKFIGGYVPSTAFKKGHKPWNTGKHHLVGENNPAWKGGKPKCIDCGITLNKYKSSRCRNCWNNFNKEDHRSDWKGEDALTRTKHDWIIRKLGRPNTCDICKKSKSEVGDLQWSNKDHKYRRVVEDWQRLCVKCHTKYDKRMGLRFNRLCPNCHKIFDIRDKTIH